MSNKSINLILFTLLIFISGVSIAAGNYFILTANVCVLSGVIVDQWVAARLASAKTTMQRLVWLKRLQKCVPLLWLCGGLAIVAWGGMKFWQ